MLNGVKAAFFFASIVAAFAGAHAQPTYVVRVGLVSHGQTTEFSVSSPAQFAVYDARSQRRLGVYRPNSSITIKRSADGLVAVAGTTVSAAYVASEASVLGLTGPKLSRRYRGWLFFGTSGGSLYAVNEVPLEEYLQGVLPCEMSPSSPAEALKAQAVAARSYTLRKIGHFKDQPYDVDDTVRTQAYFGMEKEDPRSTAAVQATRRQVLFYNGAVVNAIYGAVSGGQTENCHEVWGGSPVPYLMSFPDVDERGRPYAEGARLMTWNTAYTQQEFENLLRAGGYSLGAVVEVWIAETTSSGRVASVRIVGTHGEATIRGNDLRWILGVDRLRSTWFNVGRTSVGWEFAGRGWGHGVGMCQEGAKGRALAGQSYLQILGAYYPGAELRIVQGDPLALATRGSIVDRKRGGR